jgi:DNA recombination protein RmuC
VDSLLLSVLAVSNLAALTLALIALFKRPSSVADVSTPLQNLALSIQQSQAQSAVLAEKLARLEPIVQAVGGIQIELRGLSERTSKVEQNQSQVSQGVFDLGTGLAQASTVARSLVEATSAIRTELTLAKSGLTELHAHTMARHQMDQRTADSIRRIEVIIAGTQTKGSAGENILEVVFAKLPADWQVRNLRVGDKVVEFGLRLPNNLILPIDSKWAATNLLEQLANSEDGAEQKRLKAQIEETVIARAKEIRKYIDPNITMSFGVAAVPDAVYDVCAGVHAEVFQLNVVLVSYSLFLPYLLLVVHMMFKTSQSVDLRKLDAYLQGINESLRSMQEELEGRVSRALTMLTNSRDEMRLQLGRLNSGMKNLQTRAATGHSLPASVVPGGD